MKNKAGFLLEVRGWTFDVERSVFGFNFLTSRIKVMIQPSAQKGFTLLEILLALAILSVSLTWIMQNFSNGMRIANNSKTYTTAVIYAKQKLEEFQLQEEIEETEESGSFDDGYSWRITIVPYEDFLVGEEEDEDLFEHLPLEMFRLDSVVSWMEGEREKSVSLSTLKTVKKQEGL